MADRVAEARRKRAEAKIAATGGERTLAHLRLLAGLSQRHVAEAIGTTQPAFSLNESGERELSLRYVKPLADVLGVTIDAVVNAAMVKRK